MARPTKPKDLKPKESEIAAVPGPAGAPAPSGGSDMKVIAIIVIMSLVSMIGTVGGMYALGQFVLVPAITESVGSGGTGAHGEADPHAAAAEHPAGVGMNLELDEFMVNLKVDPTQGGNQYLRAKMALSIQVPTEEDCYATHASLPDGGTIAGAAAPVDRETLASGGGGGPSCEDIFKGNMSKFVPTIRDIINGALMKRTAGTLSSLEGQEDLKDEIKEGINGVVAPKYQVLRVNFQDFIIQR